MNNNDNIINVSVSINANVTLTPEMKDEIRKRFPYVWMNHEHDDEGLAICALFASMEEHVPVESMWFGLIKNIKLG